MSAAPVGFQCPECVREGQQQTRQVVTPMGGEPIRDFYVTKVLIGINVGLFIVEMVAGMDAVIRLRLSCTAVCFILASTCWCSGW